MMKTDYRVICCIVAWLCCTAVHCLKDTSDWDNLDNNVIEDFGRKYNEDDKLSFLGKAYDTVNDLKSDEGTDDGGETCGEDCINTGGECKNLKDDGELLECNCPPNTRKTENKCTVEEGKCVDVLQDCEETGGTCFSSKGGIKCISCPVDTIADDTGKKCIVKEGKCKEEFSECESTGGACISSKKGIKCSCPPDTTVDDTEKKCIVTDTECGVQLPNCKSTGGTCLSTDKGIKCSCPKDTIVEETDNRDKKCIVKAGKCVERFKNCESTGGKCLSTTEGIKCSCPEDTSFDETDGKCTVNEDKCTELFPNCKSTGGSCLFITGAIKCSCPTDTTFDEAGGKCIVEEKKCKEKLPNCKSTGGTCLSTTEGISCICPTDTVLEETGTTDKKCMVAEEKCKEIFPNCKTTGGTCLSTTGGINCSCPEGTGFKDTEKKCVVENTKCEELFPNCKSSGGSCSSTTDGIKCNCPKNTTLDETDEKCTVAEEKCKDIFPNCKTTGGTCLSTTGGIKCSCPEGTGFKDTEKKCVACDCGDGAAFCKFVGNIQKCYCKVNHALDKDQKCKACDCGEGASTCSFDDNDVQKCVCKDKFSLKEGKCHACYCGVDSQSCKFEGDNKMCTCKAGYADKAGTCADCNCGDSSKGCSFDSNDKKTCDCKPKFGDKSGKCTACDCGDQATGCTFVGEAKTCECINQYADKEGKCEKCNCGDAVSKGCSFKGKDKTCDCNKDYAQNKDGKCQKDYCQIKCGCEAGGCGDDMECDEESRFKEDVNCDCLDEKKFDIKLKKCRKPCEKKEGCKYEAECSGDANAKFCVCPTGTSGDTCEEVDACKEGGKYAKCEGEQGECDYDAKKKEPVCKCAKDKTLDDKKNYCVDKFCAEGNCLDGSDCVYDKETLTGYCSCSKGQYYDYQANRCKAPDKCLLKKTACKENEKCVDGECKCSPPHEKDGEKCIMKFCKPNSCFPGANCSETDGSCFCQDGKIFTGSRCEEKKCILNEDYAEECDCPKGMERKEGGKCVPRSTSTKTCETDCGYGLCVNENCRCFDGAELISKICVLKKSFCASGQLLNGSHSQCNCTGKYKQADDKKTCALVTCNDEYAKSYCAKRGATCRMNWKGKPQFECICPDGYTMDNDREICSDPCSIQKNIDTCLKESRFCFNSNSKNNLLTGDCRCPPPFSNKKDCLQLDKNIFLISGIPVMKKNYEMKHGINHVLLNTHLIQSLAQTYSSAVYDYGYLYDYEVKDKEIICSVWIRFKQDASEQLKRLPFQAKQFTEGVCDDCDTNMYVWPPALPLSKIVDKDTTHYENLNLCSPAVKDKLCGADAGCDVKKDGCYCPRGFRMLEYTVRFTDDNKRIQRCEATTKSGDLDECAMGTHNCPKNTKCVKIPGDFICQCKPGFWKENNYDKMDCQDLCSKKPCAKGSCSMKKDAFNCKCEPGYGGSRCDEKDVNYASAKKSTVVVGSVLGVILIVGIIAFGLYYRKLRKSSYSEDFMPAPSHAEMTERRPMRGVVNKSYE